MRKVALSAMALALFGCETDIGIDDPGKAIGVPNPPVLTNPVKHDRIVQVTTLKVDVLWVIDNCLMDEEQRKLVITSVCSSSSSSTGLDWHRVTSTDTESAQAGRPNGSAGYRYPSPDSPEPEGLFFQMAVLGYRLA